MITLPTWVLDHPYYLSYYEGRGPSNLSSVLESIEKEIESKARTIHVLRYAHAREELLETIERKRSIHYDHG